MDAKEFSIKHPTGANDCYAMHVEIASYGANAEYFYKAMESFAFYYHECKINELSKANVIKSVCECGKPIDCPHEKCSNCLDNEMGL